MNFPRKNLALLVAFISMCLLVSACTSQKREAKLVLESISTGMETWDRPYFEGIVKNTGNGTAWNAGITFTIYSDASKTTIIDTAFAYLADGNNIGPGESVVFHATAFNCDSVDDLQYYSYRIEWLNR